MRQRKRKLEAVKGNAVKALSFTESYGLIADTLTAHTASGKRVRISLSDSDAQIEERKELEVLYLLHGQVRCERCVLPRALNGMR